VSRVRTEHRLGTRRVLVFALVEGRSGLIGIHYSITLEEVRLSVPPGKYRFVLQRKVESSWEHVVAEEAVIEKTDAGPPPVLES